MNSFTNKQLQPVENTRRSISKVDDFFYIFKRV